MGAYEDYLAQLAGATPSAPSAMPSAYPTLPQTPPQPEPSYYPTGQETPGFYESYVAPVLDPALAGLEKLTYPLTLPKQGVDWLARQGAHAMGLNVPDTMTVGQMARQALVPQEGAEPTYYEALGGKAVELGADLGLDPLTWAMGGAGKTGGKIAAAAFAPSLAVGAVREGAEAAREISEDGMTPQAAEALLGAGVSGAFAYGAGRHALGHEAPAAATTPEAETAPLGEPETVTRYATAKKPQAPPNELGFYSQLERVADQMPQAMKAGDALRYFSDPKRGVKAEEMKATGLDDFLQERADSGQGVTPQEVQEFVRTNKAELREVVRGGLDKEVEDPITKAGWDAIEAMGNLGYEDSAIAITNLRRSARERGVEDAIHHAQIYDKYKPAVRAMLEMPARLDPKFDRPDLVTPGGKNYREFELIMPERNRPDENWATVKNPDGTATYNETVYPNNAGALQAAVEANAKLRGLTVEKDQRGLLFLHDASGGTVAYGTPPEMVAYLKKAGANSFTGGHFPEPNVVAHARVNERFIPDENGPSTDESGARGYRTAHIEEVQSDWAQKGRKEGFRSETDAAESLRLSKEATEIRSRAERMPVRTDEQANARAAEFARARDLTEQSNKLDRRGRHPEGPYVTDTSKWSELAMKRMVKWAADNGFDRLTWTTGEQQAARYDLSKHVDSIVYHPTEQRVVGIKGGNPIFDENATPDKLPGIIGKEAAQKLLAAPVGADGFRGIEGQDLKVGGTGMSAFYGDKGGFAYDAQGNVVLDEKGNPRRSFLHIAADKIAKKFGARVGETRFGNVRNGKALGPTETAFGQAAVDAIRRNDDLGFDRTSQALAAIRQHNDWAQRWDVRDPADVAAINAWRNETGTTVHSLDLSPQMRESVTKEGFPQFAVGERGGQGEQLTLESVAKDIPGFDFYPHEDGGFRAPLKNGGEVRVLQTGDIHITSPSAVALSQEANPTGGKRPVGSTLIAGRNAIIQIAEGAPVGTTGHEAYHVIEKLALKPDEIALVEKKYGNVEQRAYAYADWAQNRHLRVNSWFSKIMALAQRLVHRFKPTAESTFEEVYSGRAGKRIAGERVGAERGPPAAETQRFATEAQPPGEKKERSPSETLPPTPVEEIAAGQSKEFVEALRPKIPRTPPRGSPEAFVRGGPGIEGKPGGREGVPREIAPDIGLNIEKMGIPDEEVEYKGRIAEVMKEANSELARSEPEHWTDIDPEKDRILATMGPEEAAKKLDKGLREKQSLMKAVRYGAKSFWRDADTKYEIWQDDPTNRKLEADYVKANLHATAFEMFVTDQKTAAARLLASLREVLGDAKKSGEFDIERLTRSLRKAGISEKDAAALTRVYRESPHLFGSALRTAFEPQWRDKLMYAYRAHLLSGAPTTWANALGNTGSIAANVAETATGGLLESIEAGKRRVLGQEQKPLSERQRFVSDAPAQIKAMYAEFPTALKELIRDIGDITPGFKPKGGRKAKGGESRWGIADVPISMEKILEHKGPPVGKSPVARAYFKAAGRAYQKLEVWDNFFGKLIKAGEWAKVANREARRKGYKGRDATEHAKQWLQDDKRKAVFAESVAHETNRQLFKLDLTSDRGTLVALGGWAQDLTRRIPWSQIVAPFVKTPTNILDMTLRFTPKGFLEIAMRDWGKNEGALKQLEGKKATLPEGEYEKSRGELLNKRGEMLDRAGASLFGSLVMIPAFYSMAKAGFLTSGGPKDQREKKLKLATGWRPYSLHIGDTYIPLNRLEPIGTLLGYTADFAEILEGKKEGGVSYENLVGMFVENMKDKPFLTGLSNLFEVMQSPSKALEKITVRTLANVVPTGVANVAKAYDPVIRDYSEDTIKWEILRAIQARVPGASTALPAQLTATGKEANRGGSAISRLLSPAQYATEEEGTDVEREMLRVGYNPSLPRKDIRLPGGTRLKLSANDYRTLLGSYDDAAKEVGQMIETSAYRNAPDTIEEGGGRSKEGMIKRIYDKYREEARMKMYQSLQKRRALPGQTYGASL